MDRRQAGLRPVGDLEGREARTDPALLEAVGFPHGGGSVLLVEDEESLASLVQAYLVQEGFTVSSVGSGEAALARIEREPVRLVVLDLNLPDMDGLDVCRRIRARSSVPVVMLTARDEEADRLAGLGAGADDYIGKPFSPKELVARMKAVLRRSEPAAGTSRC